MDVEASSASDMDMGRITAEDPWDETINLETKFYDEGYNAGHDHGKLHGLFEGRELGQEKAWEIWEEVGYMEGFAEFWVEELELGGQAKGKDARALSHARQLLALIDTFPTINLTSTPSVQSTMAEPYSSAFAAPVDDQSSDPASEENAATTHFSQSAKSEPEPDLILLLSSIRARYKLLCSSLGVRPRLVTAAVKDGSTDGTGEESGDVQIIVEAEGVVQGIEGPMKGVDTRMLRY